MTRHGIELALVVLLTTFSHAEHPSPSGTLSMTMPVLAVGGETSFGALQAEITRHVVINVQEAVVPHSGHWLMEESPVYTVKLVREFLDPRAPRTSVLITSDNEAVAACVR